MLIPLQNRIASFLERSLIWSCPGSQALANALLVIAARERLAAGIRQDPLQFEALRSFQAALSSPLAAAAVKQSLAQLQSFVTAL